MKSERDLFELWCTKDDEFCIHRYACSDDYSDDYTQCAWMAWQASANREGYKLVPVDSLKIVLNCIDQDNLFFINGAFKALDDVEEAMIGANE